MNQTTSQATTTSSNVIALDSAFDADARTIKANQVPVLHWDTLEAYYADKMKYNGAQALDEIRARTGATYDRATQTMFVPVCVHSQPENKRKMMYNWLKANGFADYGESFRKIIVADADKRLAAINRWYFALLGFEPITDAERTYIIDRHNALTRVTAPMGLIGNK